MTLDELIAKLEEASAAVPELVLKQTEGAALGALALVDLRITETGTNAQGSPFEPYTPSYGKKKKALGRDVGHVNFSLSGQMLASTTTGFENIAPTEKSLSGATAKVKFDGRDKLTKDKLAGNNKNRPGFMNPSTTEIDMVSKSANTGMERDLQEILT